MTNLAARSPWIRLAFYLIILWIGFLWLTPLAMIQFVTRRYQVKVSGMTFPIGLMPGHFRLKNPQIEWKGNIKITSGLIDIQVRRISLRPAAALISVHGSELEASMGKKIFPVPTADVTIQFQKETEPIIHSLVVDSPEIQIELAEK